MKIEQFILTCSTFGRGTQNITSDVIALFEKADLQTGFCNLFIQHTSASLIICENFDPDVRSDLENFLARLVKDGDSLFKHICEGKDDMPSHIRTLLTETSLTIPIYKSKLALGRWQGIYLYEHRLQGMRRDIVVTLSGYPRI